MQCVCAQGESARAAHLIAARLALMGLTAQLLGDVQPPAGLGLDLAASWPERTEARITGKPSHGGRGELGLENKARSGESWGCPPQRLTKAEFNPRVGSWEPEYTREVGL